MSNNIITTDYIDIDIDIVIFNKLNCLRNS